MNRQLIDPAAVDAEVDRLRPLGIDALRARWRLMFGGPPPPGLTKDIIKRMIAHRLQEETFGWLDREQPNSSIAWRAERKGGLS
jgi:Protein of unknown function (DUF2924)